MPTLGNALDFAKYEARNLRGHILGTAPSSPVTGQLYYNSGDNTLYWWDGSAWVSARGGASATPPATTGALGTIQLAGDLAGTATSPQIKAGSIVLADFDTTLTDGDQAKPQPRYLSNGGNPSHALPASSTVSDLQSPTYPLSMNSQRITNLADPTAATDGANKQYVDAVAQGLAPKDSVRAATTANIVIATALNAGDVIDGVTLANGDRVLVKDQTATQENGIYVVGATPTRATDADAWSELIAAFTFVEQGSAAADSGWVCTVDQGGTLGTTSVTWVQFSGAGQLVAGQGLQKSGPNTIDVGPGAGITVSADGIAVANNGITNAMLADGAVDLNSNDVINALPTGKGGTGATSAAGALTSLGAAGYYTTTTHSAGTTITIAQATHGLRVTRGLLVQVQDAATGAVELPDIAVAANGDVTVTFGASVTANSKRVTVIG